MKIDNQAIYDANWPAWVEMKVQGPASRWLRILIRSQLDRLTTAESIRSILDVGCGEGTITHAMAEWLPKAQVVGIDFSKSGIDCAESRYRRDNLRFVHDETSQMLLQRYDLITAFEVLEHIENWPQFLARVASAARRYVLLTFPTGRMRPFEKALGHYRNFAPGEVEQFMAERGFEPCSVWYAGFPFYSPLYRDFCNVVYSANPSFVTGSYGFSKRTLSSAIYFLFRFLSTRRKFGDQFCGLFIRKSDATDSLPTSA